MSMNKKVRGLGLKSVALALAVALGGVVAAQAAGGGQGGVPCEGGPGAHGGPGPHGGPGGPGGPGPHAMGGPRGMEFMLDQVDATDAQRKQIQGLMDAAFKDSKAAHEALQQLHKDSRSLLSAASIDGAAVEAKRLQIQAQQEIISKRMSQAMVDTAKVLTAEQRAKLAERMARHEARMAERAKEHSPKRGN